MVKQTKARVTTKAAAKTPTARPFTSYFQAAMRQATYEVLPDDGTYFGHIPACQGVWANAKTLEACREELEEVLEDWSLAQMVEGLSMPIVDGIDLNIKEKSGSVPRFGRSPRRDLVRYLKDLAFSGPVSRTKHEIMQRGNTTMRLPNPHEGDISIGLLNTMLRQAGIAREDWEKL